MSLFWFAKNGVAIEMLHTGVNVHAFRNLNISPIRPRCLYKRETRDKYGAELQVNVNKEAPGLLGKQDFSLSQKAILLVLKERGGMIK